jgi:hypothetical protein
MVAVALEGGIFEHLIDVIALRSHTHILLTESSRVLTEICILLLLREYSSKVTICIGDLRVALRAAPS